MDEASQINADWTSILCANETVCGYSAYVSVGAGQHSVYHTNACARIGVTVYGFIDFDGIGYLAMGGPKSLAIPGNTATVLSEVLYTHWSQCVSQVGI